MKIKINKINELFNDIENLEINIQELKKKFIQTNSKFNVLALFIGNLISDNGITKKISVYCNDYVLQKNFCYEYLNNLIIPIKFIIEWKKKKNMYDDIINNLDKIYINNSPENIDYELTGNYLKNSPDYSKIIGKEVLIDFSKKDSIIDKPNKFILSGKIKDFNNPYRFFFFIDSFLIDFSNLSKQQLKIIEKTSKENNWNCWKSDKKYHYNIVLSNLDNNGFRFKFKENVGNLGLNKNYLLDNIEINNKVENNKIAFTTYKVNQLIPCTSLICYNLNYKDSSDIIELLKEMICLDKIYLYTLDNLNINLYLKLSIISEIELNSLINSNNFLYSKEDIILGIKKINKLDKDFNLKYNKYFPIYLWSWMIFLKPEIISLEINNKKYTDIQKKFNNQNILPFLLWKLESINNCEKIIYTSRKKIKNKFINLLNINNINEFIKNITHHTSKIIYLKTYLTKIKLLSNNKNISIFSRKIEMSMSDMLNILKKTNTYKNLKNKCYLCGLYKITNKINNNNLKKILYLLIIESLNKEVNEANENIKNQFELWSYFINIISTQFTLSGHNQDKNLIKKPNYKFNRYFENIKVLYKSISCP